MADYSLMTTARPTWIIVVRDLSHAVRIEDQPDTTVCMVLDADTGLVRGVSMAGDPREACAGAVASALTEPTMELPPAQPAQVVCVDERTLRLARPHLTRQKVTVKPIVASSPAAEDVVDSLVGHLAGRGVPIDAPAPDDWIVLFDALHRLAKAEPWRRWADSDYFDLKLTKDDASAAGGSDYVVVVMGQAGIQRGLNLWPGPNVPSLTGDWSPGEPAPLPAGTLLVWLDPPDEVPPEYLAKATRYGWPSDAKLFPTPLAIGAHGPIDVGRGDVHDLTLAAVAMVAHLDAGSDVTEGEVPLADGHTGTFAVRRRPPPRAGKPTGRPKQRRARGGAAR
jgi:hypothetical protein